MFQISATFRSQSSQPNYQSGSNLINLSPPQKHV